MQKTDPKNEWFVHAVFALLFFSSGFYGDRIARLLPGWRDPKVGLLCVAIGLVWLLRYFLSVKKELSDEVLVLKDRVERAELHIRELEERTPRV